MKYLYLTLCLVFVSFAIMQYNDPDPYIWAPYYVVVALICFYKFKGVYHPWLVIPALVVSIACAISYIPEVIAWLQSGMPGIASAMKAETAYIENMREFLGIVVSIFSMLPIYLSKPSKAEA